MNQISFPGINLNLNISPIAFNIFGLEIYWYAVIIVVAIITALLVCKKNDGLYDIKLEAILDLVLYMIPISIISARLYYILFNLNYYIEYPKEIFNIRSGGLAIYGGIIGGILTIWIFAKKRKLSTINMLDYIVPSLTIGQAIGRWGNFVNAEAYGIKTNLPWRMGVFENGEYIEVHPTFLYESICCTIIFVILLKLQKKRKFKGEITATYLICYGVVRAVTEYFRADSLMLR